MDNKSWQERFDEIPITINNYQAIKSFILTIEREAEIRGREKIEKAGFIVGKREGDAFKEYSWEEAARTEGGTNQNKVGE